MSTLEDNVAAGIMLELGAVAARLNELVDVLSGESIIIPRRFLLDANYNPRDWKSHDAGRDFHAVKVDNPSDVTVYVGFASGAGTPERYDEIVPPRTGRILTRPFNVLSIGVAAADVANVRPIPTTIYSRAVDPTTYALGTLFTQTSPRPYTPRGGELIVADATNKALDPTKYPGAGYALLRVDPLAAAGDGIWFTDNGTDPTNAANPRVPLVAGEEIEIAEANLANVHMTRLAANNVNVYVQGRSYP